ncbi:MAG: methyltransferase domain-containing protein [Elainellaceae cyanobacterium]
MSRISCPICFNQQSTQLEKIELGEQHRLYAPGDVESQQLLTKLASISVNSYVMMKCGRCELEYANPLVAPSESWYSLAYDILSLYPSNRWEFDYVLERLDSNDFVAEIGCGSGFFLKKLRDRKIRHHGFDFINSSILSCLEQNLTASLIDISRDCTELINKDKRVTAIASFHVLEHLENPNTLFQWARKVSLDNATLWVSVPSDRRPTRVLKEVEYLDQPPHHITRWNRSAFEKIGHQNNWELVNVIYEPISFRTALWWYSTRTQFYRSFYCHTGKSNKWTERLLRYASYPFALDSVLTHSTPMSGFSMLAKYVKRDY